MKWLILLFAGLSSIAAQAQGTAPGVADNVTPFALQKVTVSGTVEVQETQGALTRVRITPLNNKRIFSEFTASKADYQLVLDLNTGGTLELIPKSASAGMPTVEVAALTASQFIVDSKLNVNDTTAQISSNALGNLFQGLNGAVAARLTFKGPVANNVLKKCVLTGIAVGKNQGGGANTTALLKFKGVTTGVFVQQP